MVVVAPNRRPQAPELEAHLAPDTPVEIPVVLDLLTNGNLTQPVVVVELVALDKMLKTDLFQAMVAQVWPREFAAEQNFHTSPVVVAVVPTVGGTTAMATCTHRVPLETAASVAAVPDP
jgi:hypothetical protein